MSFSFDPEAALEKITFESDGVAKAAKPAKATAPEQGKNANFSNFSDFSSGAPPKKDDGEPSVQRDARRQKVLQLMDEEPRPPRAWYADSESDPDYVILAFAKRVSGGIYTCELTVEREKWDPFLFLELMDKEH